MEALGLTHCGRQFGVSWESVDHDRAKVDLNGTWIAAPSHCAGNSDLSALILLTALADVHCPERPIAEGHRHLLATNNREENTMSSWIWEAFDKGFKSEAPKEGANDPGNCVCSNDQFILPVPVSVSVETVDATL